MMGRLISRGKLEALKRDVISFAGMLKEMAANYSPMAGEDDDAISAVSSKTVGLSDQCEQLKDQVNRIGGRLMPEVEKLLASNPSRGRTRLKACSSLFDEFLYKV